MSTVEGPLVKLILTVANIISNLNLNPKALNP